MEPRLPGDTHSSILQEVEGYYSARLAEHGATPRGVDWNGDESQRLRFEQLGRLVEPDRRFSLNDVGCGYGAMLDFLKRRYAEFDYFGSDISSNMIAAARERHGDARNIYFSVESTPSQIADYSVASGIFNVRLNRTDEEWQAYLQATLDGIAAASRRGFAFNCLTSYSDAGRKRDYLFYADPCALFDLCKRRYSRQVALLHDYGLYEFTILVRNET